MARCVASGKAQSVRCGGHFGGNAGNKAVKNLPVPLKCQLKKRSITSVLDCRCSRWPPQKAICDELDVLRRRMYATVDRVQRRDFESVVEFCWRRAQTASRQANNAGLWSNRWCARACRYDIGVTSCEKLGTLGYSKGEPVTFATTIGPPCLQQVAQTQDL